MLLHDMSVKQATYMLHDVCAGIVYQDAVIIQEVPSYFLHSNCRGAYL